MLYTGLLRTYTALLAAIYRKLQELQWHPLQSISHLSRHLSRDRRLSRIYSIVRFHVCIFIQFKYLVEIKS